MTKTSIKAHLIIWVVILFLMYVPPLMTEAVPLSWMGLTGYINDPVTQYFVGLGFILGLIIIVFVSIAFFVVIANIYFCIHDLIESWLNDKHERKLKAKR